MSEVKRYRTEEGGYEDSDGRGRLLPDGTYVLASNYDREKSRADEWEKDFSTLCKERDALRIQKDGLGKAWNDACLENNALVAERDLLLAVKDADDDYFAGTPPGPLPADDPTKITRRAWEARKK